MVFENYDPDAYSFPRKRYKLDDDFDLICPSCLYGGNLSKNAPLGKYYIITCPNCKNNVGFVKGKVKARKLGSYIRLIDTKDKQLSIDIHFFNKDFDVRKDDIITLVFYLKFTDKTPVLILNHTVKEFYNFEVIHIKGKIKLKVDLVELKDYKKVEFEYSQRILEDLPELYFINLDASWLP